MTESRSRALSGQHHTYKQMNNKCKDRERANRENDRAHWLDRVEITNRVSNPGQHKDHAVDSKASVECPAAT